MISISFVAVAIVAAVAIGVFVVSVNVDVTVLIDLKNLINCNQHDHLTVPSGRKQITIIINPSFPRFAIGSH